MKRVLAVAAIAAFAGAMPAGADHLCVTSNGQKVYCAPELKEMEPVCVSRGSTTIVCTP